MAVTLGLSALRGVLRMPDAIRLLEEMLAHEAAGRTLAAPRFNAEFEGGSMRILFAADYEAGYCATKAYHSLKGAGVRSVITLYRLKDGELLAFLDGSHITDLRTGAASGVVARKVALGATSHRRHHRFRPSGAHAARKHRRRLPACFCHRVQSDRQSP